jgi:hypothetical protein
MAFKLSVIMANKSTVIQTPQGILKTMRFIHPALLIGQTLFAVIIFATNKNSIFFDVNNMQNVLFYLVPVFAISAVFFSIIIYKRILSQISDGNLLIEKMKSYQVASIRRFAFLEGASLFGIAVFSNTGNLFYLAISACLMVYFIFLRPTVNTIETDMQLSYEEKLELE